MEPISQPKIKINLGEILQSDKPVILNLGCGEDRSEGRIGIDILDLPSVDIVADLEKGFPYLPDNSVDQIHSKSLFEHIENTELFMREIVRVLKKGGTNHAFIPHFSNPYFYSDYTHHKFFGLYSFYYFVEKKHQLRRHVPNFYTDIRIRVVSQKLIFRSPFKGRDIFKRFFGLVINSHRYLQEFYEENLCYIIPCYGMEIVFRADK